MFKLLSLSLAAALCAPAFAQQMGSINSNPPKVNQTLTNGDAKISLNYTSIAWGQGKTFEMAMNKENGARARQRINDQAKSQPLGSFSTSVPITCGSLQIPAGEYKVAFTISDDCEWQINFMGAQTLTMKLQLTDNKEHEHKRLLMSLYAGDQDGAGCYVAFGSKMTMLAFVPAVEKKG
jgi:hypothetical protein